MSELFIPGEARPQVLQALIQDAWVVGAMLEASHHRARPEPTGPAIVAERDKPDVARPGEPERPDR